MINELKALEKRQAELQLDLARLDQPRPTNALDIDPELVRSALASANEVERGIILRGFIQRITAAKISGSTVGEIAVGQGDTSLIVPL